MNEIVKLAIDAYHGRVEKYSVAQSQDVLRQALIEKNNGKTYLDYKDIRDGKCQGLFTLIETILSKTVVEGLQGDEYFNALAEMRNVAEGDSLSSLLRTIACSLYPRLLMVLRVSGVSVWVVLPRPLSPPV